MLPILDDRLMSAASLVRRGSRFADIGSDHAYLPIYLCKSGVVDVALASDINKGPVAAALENIKEFGVEDKVTAMLSDGLLGAREFCPDDIAILGMGGELILSIIDKADWVKNENIRLILQPMTHAHTLYKYLLSNGFEIADEKICATSSRTDRIYRVICAEYSGTTRECSEVEAMVGIVNMQNLKNDKNGLIKKYIQHLIDIYTVRINGKEKSGADSREEKELVLGLSELL